MHALPASAMESVYKRTQGVLETRASANRCRSQRFQMDPSCRLAVCELLIIWLLR